MRLAYIARIEPGGHGLDALTFPGQEQASGVEPQRLVTVGVAECSGETINILLKTLLTGSGGRG